MGREEKEWKNRCRVKYDDDIVVSLKGGRGSGGDGKGSIKYFHETTPRNNKETKT
jgi:hypothetical protein